MTTTTNNEFDQLVIASGVAGMAATASTGMSAQALTIAGARQEVVFIEDNVADLDALVQSLGADKEVVILDSTGDGLQQIAEALAGRSGIDALHIITHGAEGQLDLGSLSLDATSLAERSSLVASIGATLADGGDILLYGCDVAAGQGASFVEQLAIATGADVAASDDLTGDAGLGGDWNLEVASGSIETASAVNAALAAQYHSVLNITNKTVSFDSAAYSYGWGGAGVDLTYTLPSDAGYTVKFDGAADGVGSYQNGFIAFAANDSETAIRISFGNGKVFTPTSVDLNKLTSTSQTLVFTGLDASNQTIVSREVNVDSDSFVLKTLANFSNITTLLITPKTGTIQYFQMDNLVLADVGTADTTPPTVTITSDRPTLSAGQTATITFSFSEAPTGFSAADIAVSGGTLSALSGSGTTRTAIFTPASGIDNGTASITVAAGSYTDAAGNAGGAGASPSLTYDTSAPAAPAAPDLATASDSGNSSTDNVTNVMHPTFGGAAGSAEAGATIRVYDGASLIATTTAFGDGSWSVASNVNLAQGQHTISATATDAAGNASAASAALTVTIDATPPATQVVAAALSNDSGASATDMITSQANQIISGVLSASLGAGEQVYVSLDNGQSWTTASATVGSNTWSLAATLGGSGVLQVRVIDAAGNAGTAYTHAYVLDTTAPAAPSTPDLDAGSDTGISNGDDITGNTMPTFSGSAEVGATVTLYDGATAIGSAVATDGSWQITSEVALGQGSHAITAVAADLAGNRGAASAALTIQVITDAPTTRVTGLLFSADSGASATDLVTRVAAQTLAGTLNAEVANGEYVEVSINGGAWQAADTYGTGWSLAATLDAGTHPIAVRLTNAVGNSSEPYVRDYTLDTVAPGVTIGSSAAQLKAGQSATITFTFSEDPGNTFTWDGSAGDVVVSGGTLSAISGTGTTRTAVFTPDADTDGGSASITIAAGAYADLAGNAGSAGAMPSLNFDTLVPFAPSAPVLAAGSDTGASSSDNLTANDRPAFTGSAESGATVTLYDTDGNAIGSGIAVDGVWSIVPVSALGNGVHTIAAQAHDAAGNASAVGAALTITVDHTAPTLAITSDVAQLKLGETAIITFTFSEDPGTSFMRSDVSVEGGTIGALSGTGLTRMAVFTPAAGVDGGTASIAVNGGAYTDIAGNAGGAGVTPVLRFDTRAPAAPSTPDLDDASDSGASSSDDITAITTPTFSGTAEDGARVTLYDGATAIGSATAVDGRWHITSEVALQQGTHAITAIALDAAGNASPVSGALAMNVLTHGPATTVSGVALSSDSGVSDTDFVTRVAGQTISGGLSTALASGEHVQVSIDGGQSWVMAAAAAGDGDWTLSTVLLSGTHEIQVKVVDAVGNDGPVLSQVYTLDSVAPGVTIASDVTQLKAGESATITFTFSEDPGSTFTQADVQVEGGTLGALSGSGLVRTATFIPVAGLDDGMAGITVNAGSYTDKAGNAGTAGATPSLSFDTLRPDAPSVPLLAAGSDTGVSDRDGMTANDKPTFTGTAESGASVTLYDDSGNAIGSGTAVDGVWSIVPAAALADGEHMITAVAVDAAGNASASSAALTVTIDTTAPALSITSDATQLKAGETATITFTFSEDPGATFTAGAVQVEGGTLSALAGTGATRTAVFTPSANIDGGVASITIAAGAYADLAGNAGTAGAALSLRVDTQAPAAPVAPVLAAASDTDTVGDGITTSTTQAIEGVADAGAVVTLYDGETALGSVRAGTDGKWSIAASLALGSHALSVTQADAAGNVSAHSAAFALSVEAAIPVVDGMPVQTAAVTLPGGVAGTSVSVPVVTGARGESAGAAGVADIPLATSGGNQLLLAQLPVGYGLSASGATVGVASGLAFLIASIEAATPAHAADDQGHLTGNGQAFLAGLASSASLLVETVTPVSTAPDGTLVLSGAGAAADQNVALVIDTGGLATGSKLMLQQVDFAAIVGAADVSVGSAGTILSGDAASQHFTVTAGDAGALFAGGGDDVLTFARSQAAQAGSPSGHASTVSLLHGGLASDTAVFSGARADYQVEQHNGYVVVSSMAAPDAKALVVNVEQLQFSDGTVTLEQSAAQDIVAGMYQTVLGRQADLYGFEYWADLHDAGESWGSIALHMIDSAEHKTDGDSFNGNDAHDIALLYQALFERAPEAEGLAYWQDQMAHGATLAQVADSLVGSAEMVGHQRTAGGWDFSV